MLGAAVDCSGLSSVAAPVVAGAAARGTAGLAAVFGFGLAAGLGFAAGFSAGFVAAGLRGRLGRRLRRLAKRPAGRQKHSQKRGENAQYHRKLCHPRPAVTLAETGLDAPIMPGMELTPDEIERYARHIVLREVGGPGQAKLKQARVLVVGAGGLGAPLLLYLAAAGVGTLGIVDDDTVSLSNLQRQVIHGTGDLDAPKVESAASAIRKINPHVRVVTHAERLTANERDGDHRRLRHRRRRLRQFRDALSCCRRLLLREEAVGHGGGRHLRRHADHDPRA